MANLLDPERRLRAALLSTSDLGHGPPRAAGGDGAPRAAGGDGGDVRGASGGEDADEDLIGTEQVDRMLADLGTHPDEVLAYARRVWDRELSGDDLRRALVALRAAIDAADSEDPREVAATLPRDLRTLGQDTRAAGDLSLGPTKLPDDWWADRPKIGVTIEPASFKFETDRDWTGWAWHTAGGWLGANALKRRADFRTGAHDYAMPAGNGFKLALFSDFGTGLYHSQYIAHFIGTRRPDAAIHLGDVYYAGKQEEFDDRFEGVLDRHLFAQSPTTKLFCLNANHEMYSRARPYFRYLDKLRAGKRSPQEGSYFRLRTGARFQVIAIDTACALSGKIAAGRFADDALHQWLAPRLAEGKREGRSTILLTSDYPYLIGKGSKTKLLGDLEPYVQQGLIDAWFWGDSHYGALYFRGPATPFIGGCLGHGGYPYYRRTPDMSAGSLAAPRFVECRTRFHGTDVRPDMGNNGFAFLTLDDTSGEAELEYVDWRNQSRVKEGLVRQSYGLDFRGGGGVRGVSMPAAIRGTDRGVRTAGDRGAVSPPAVGGPCPCEGGGFDAQAAIRDLARKVTALADAVVAQHAEPPEDPGRRSVADTGHLAGVRGAIARGLDEGDALVAKGVSFASARDVDDVARLARALRGDRGGAIARITGGTPVASTSYPSCVFLAGPGREWSCTGVLIAPRVILTAAHCGDGLVEALLGGNAIPTISGGGGVIVPLTKMIVHPDYGGTSGADANRHDIAVAILDQPTDLAPVGLATDDELAAAGTVHLVGYGFNDSAASVGLGVLRWVEVELGPVKTRADQDHRGFESEHGYTADTEFVAGRKGLGRDTCNGDSGGPAYLRDGGTVRLAGLTSRATRGHGRPCGDGGIYVRPLKYVDWIERVARDHGITLSLTPSRGLAGAASSTEA